MPIPTREDLKSFFETGDTPTQAQFGELIDAIYDLAQQSQDAADAAQALVDDLDVRAARIYGAVRFTRTAGGDMAATTIHLEGCTVSFSLASPGGANQTGTLTVTFNSAFLTTAYVCVFGVSKYTGSDAGVDRGGAALTRNTGSAIFVLDAIPNSTQSFELHFVIHRNS
jgi:hypothetical protein